MELFDDDSSSSSEEENEVGRTRATKKEKANARSVANGVLTYHAGVEDALFVHLQRKCSSSSSDTEIINTTNDDDGGNASSSSSSAAAAAAAASSCERVLKCMDEYCNTMHWMMSIGSEKRDIINEALGKSLTSSSSSASADEKEEVFTYVELGTYCGYSAISAAKFLFEESARSAKEWRIISFEIDEAHTARARKIVDLALPKREDRERVKIIQCDDGDLDEVLKAALNIDDSMKKKMTQQVKEEEEQKVLLFHDNKINFLFIDHDKDFYERDLKVVLSMDVLRRNAIVAADNVVFAKCDSYLNFVQTSSQFSGT
jgi:predicted O-methyltransferase YrrM